MEERYLQREGVEDSNRIQERYYKAVSYITATGKEWFKPKILDAGCGQGFGMEILERQLDATVIGIDCDIKAYYDYLKYNNGKGIFLQEDISSTPFQDKTFDFVFAVEIVEHLNEKQLKNFLDETHRILKDNGNLIIIMPKRRLPVNDYPSGAHFREYLFEEFLPFTKDFFSLSLFVDKESIDNRSDMYVFKKLIRDE